MFEKVNHCVVLWHVIKTFIDFKIYETFLQNSKNKWIMSIMCVCVCVCVWVCGCVCYDHQFVEYVWIMRWLSSYLRNWPLQKLGYFAYFYIAIIEPPHPILPPSDFLPGGASPSWTATSSTYINLELPH